MTGQPPLLQTRGLAVSIGGHRVCHDLDLTLDAGRRLIVLGRNGAGKSTLLATLAGLRVADAGEVLLAGQSYAVWGLRAAARLRGWLGQERSDPFASSVLEAVLTGRHPHLSRWAWESARDRQIALAALTEMKLDHLAKRPLPTLSGGERQRVAIATLLAQQPRLYLLDEPLAHLDLNHQIATLELFSRLAKQQGAACVLVLHEPNYVLRYGDDVLLLFGDGTHRVGPAGEVLDEASLSRLYAHPMRRLEAEGRLYFVPQ